MGRSVKYKFRNLTALHTRAVGALRGALELKCHLSDCHLAHALLPEIAQFPPVQNSRCCVEGFGFDLYGVVEVNVEGVAGTVREEFRVVLRQHPAKTFQFDLHTVVRRPVGGAIQAESYDEYSAVY